ARSAGGPARPCTPSSAASLAAPRPSVFQRPGRPVLVEALGGPLAGVLGAVGPVRLLVGLASVDDGLVALDADQPGHQPRFGGLGPPVDMGLQLVAEPGDDALHDGLVLEAEVA